MKKALLVAGIIAALALIFLLVVLFAAISGVIKANRVMMQDMHYEDRTR